MLRTPILLNIFLTKTVLIEACFAPSGKWKNSCTAFPIGICLRTRVLQLSYLSEDLNNNWDGTIICSPLKKYHLILTESSDIDSGKSVLVSITLSSGQHSAACFCNWIYTSLLLIERVQSKENLTKNIFSPTEWKLIINSCCVKWWKMLIGYLCFWLA